jgi:hypothetical protein
VGFYDTPGWARGIDISGNYASVAANDYGIYIFNISDPLHCSLSGSFDTPGYACTVKLRGNYAYVADETAGLRILNISNPSAIKEAGYYYLSDYSWMSSLDVRGNYAYVGYKYGLMVLDVSAVANPLPVGHWNGEVNERYCVALNGDLAYVSCESGATDILDISNPAGPVNKGSMPASLSIGFSGNYAFLPGVLVYDVADPAHVNFVVSTSISGTVYGIAVKEHFAVVLEHSLYRTAGSAEQCVPQWQLCLCCG